MHFSSENSFDWLLYKITQCEVLNNPCTIFVIRQCSKKSVT